MFKYLGWNLVFIDLKTQVKVRTAVIKTWHFFKTKLNVDRLMEKGKGAHIMHILHKDENDIINYLDITSR